MDKQKLFSISRRLSSESLKLQTPTNIYITLMTEFPYKEIMTSLSPESIIIISFLIKYYSKEKTLEDASKFIDTINSNLFGFAICEILSDEVEEECGNCYGSGEVDCTNCYGNGHEDCTDCDGSGEDSDGDTCDRCSGDGNIECDYCGGGGQETCDDCSGSGYITNDDESELYQYYYISYNSKIKDFISVLDEFDKIKHKTYHKILDDSQTIQIRRNSSTSSKDWFNDVEVGDFLFNQYTEEPTMGKGGQFLDIKNLYDM